MKKRMLILAAALAFGPLSTLAAEPQTSTVTSSLVLELSPSSSLGLEAGRVPGRDGGGPTLDQIMLDDVDTGGGSGKVRWIFEVEEGLGDDEYLLRPLQGCANGGQLTGESTVWNVTIALKAPAEPTGLIVLDGQPNLGGGVFRGEVEIPIEVRFEDTITGAVVVVDHDVIYYLRGPWAATAGPEAWESPTPFPIDTDCDGVTDAEAPPTTGAPALGWVDDSATGTAIRGTLCGAGEELGGWLCGSPALQPENPGDGLGSSGEGGMP